MEPNSFSEIIKEAMRAKGVGAQQLSEITDIPPNYIKAILENDSAHLPAAPYVHGYIETVAKVLDVDAPSLWEEYKKEASVKRSGKDDRLPINRFAQKPFNKLALAITIVILAIIAFLAPRVADFFGQPQIEITSPSSDNYSTTNQLFTLAGKIGNPRDKLLISDSEVVVNPDGSFEKQISLDPGCVNKPVFSVKRFLGLITTVERTICYEAPPIFNPTSTQNIKN